MFTDNNRSNSRAAQQANVKKYATIGCLSLAALFVGLSSTLVVDKGNVAVQTLFGKVTLDKTYQEGFHFVNPFGSYTQISVRDESIVLKGIDVIGGKAVSNGNLIIQTADKMTTGVDIEMVVQLKPEFAPYYVQQASTFNGAINKYIKPALIETIYSQGSEIKAAELLFTPEAKNSLKVGTMAGMKNYLSNKTIVGENLVNGFTVKDVKYQRLALPPEIDKMIITTQQRKEAEEIAKSNERKRQTDANAGLYEKEQFSAATKVQAEAESYRRVQNAIATEREAEAKLVTMQKDAEGIAALNKQINQQYIQYMDAQSKLVASQNYKGDTPAHLVVMGEKSSVVPFMNISK